MRDVFVILGNGLFLSERVDTSHQAGLAAVAGVLFQEADLGSLVDSLDRFGDKFLGSSFVLLINSLQALFDKILKAVLDLFVVSGTGFCLAPIFDGGSAIWHSFVTVL